MGKLDDMRRLREQQFAEGRKRQITPVAAEPAVAKKTREAPAARDGAAPAADAASAPASASNSAAAAKKASQPASAREAPPASTRQALPAAREPAREAAPPAAAKKSRADEEPAQPTRPTRPSKGKKTTSAKSGGEVDEQGKCSVCGKMKPLSNGVLAQHQKGFGKACGGSRKPPA